jgi:hypothetical protein
MRVKTLCNIRSKSNLVAKWRRRRLVSRTHRRRGSGSEVKIQALVDRGLLQPKAKVEWRATVGEQFLSEDVKE